MNKRFNIVLILCGFVLLAFFVTHAINEKSRLQKIYDEGNMRIEEGHYSDGIDMLSELGDYKDSYQIIKNAKSHLEEESKRREEEKEQEQINKEKYDQAITLYNEGKYEDALFLFDQLGTYSSSKYYAQKTEKEIVLGNKYSEASTYDDNGDYVKAIKIFKEIVKYRDSAERVVACENKLHRLMRSNSIAAGIRYSAAVKSNSSVFFSGTQYSGAEKIKDWNDIVSICVCSEFTMGLKKDGTVVSASRTDEYRVDTSEWKDIIQISAGEQFVVALNADGTLTAQGHNGDGQTNIDTWKGIVFIDTGWRHTIGIDSQGKVYYTGYGNGNSGLGGKIRELEKNGQLNNVVAFSTGGGGTKGNGHCVFLYEDGSVLAVGDNEYQQCDVDGWADIIAVSAGDYHTVALDKYGKVHTTPTDSKEDDLEVESWEHIVAVSAGYGYTLALTEDGNVLSVGNYADGQRSVDDWNDVQTYTDEWALVFTEWNNW